MEEIARIVSHSIVFFRIDPHEGYLTKDGPRVRDMRMNYVYLGDKVDAYVDEDIEALRINRAIMLLEKSGGKFLKGSKDRSSRRRLGYLLKEVMSFDTVALCSAFRSVYRGLLKAEGRDLLKGYEFNSRSKAFNSEGQVNYLDLQSGLLILRDFSPQQLISNMVNVSVITVCFLLSRVDFLTGSFITIGSDIVSLTAEDAVQDLHLDVGSIPDGDGLLMAYLWLGFERHDAVALSPLLRRSNDVFSVVGCWL